MIYYIRINEKNEKMNNNKIQGPKKKKTVLHHSKTNSTNPNSINH